MNWLYKVSYRSLAVPFYEANAVFFMIVVYFAFGILSAREHIAIAASIAVSLPVTLLVMLLWTFYILKAFLSIKNTLRKPEFRFMHMAALFSPFRRFIFFATAQLIVNLPVIAYALFILYYQILLGQLLNLIIIIVYLQLTIYIPALLYVKLLKKPYSESGHNRVQRFINKGMVKPYYLWFLFHLGVNKPGMVFLSKLLSLGIIMAFYLYYGTGEYDWRVLGLGTLFGFSGNLGLVFQYHQFEHQSLMHFRNIPIPVTMRMVFSATALFLLLVPELLLAFRFFPDDQPIMVYLILMLFGYSLCLMLLQIPLLKMWEQESLIKFHFFGFLTLFIYILYGFSLVPLALLMSMIFVVIGSNYYRLVTRYH
jgi:hypothetical protein